MIINKILNFGLRAFLLGLATILTIYFGAKIFEPSTALSIDYLMHLTILFGVVLFAYFLLTKKKINYFELLAYSSGLATGIWLFDRSLEDTLLKNFIGSLIITVVLILLIKLFKYILYRFKKDISFKNGIHIVVDINAVNKLGKNNSLSVPLDSFEKIKKIRQNLDDEGLFSALEGVLDKLKNVVRNKKNIKLNRVFCIDGRWGSGKTTLLKLLKESLSRLNNKNDKKYKEPVWLDFNPWLYNNQDELVKDFFEDFKHNAYEHWGLNLEPEISTITKTVTPSLEGLDLKIPFIDLLPKLFTKFKTSEDNKDELNKKLERIDRPFVIVFDDVDRPCETTEIILIVKLISILSKIKNVTVLAAFDYKRVGRLISEQTKDIGQRFLEKFINKNYPIPEYEYKELESIFLSRIIDSNKLSKDNKNIAKPAFEEFVWAMNREWFKVSSSQESKTEDIALNPLYERYKDIYITLNPGGNYFKDYNEVINNTLMLAITNLINGSTPNMESLIRSFVKPIQKIIRARLWKDFSPELKNGLVQFDIPDSEEVYTTISSFLNEREDLYGQNLHDQILGQFAPLEQRYPKMVSDNDYKKTYEGFRNAFLAKIQEYINRYEDVKGEDYIKIVNWLVTPMTPRDVVKFTSNVEEELTDWDNKDIIQRIVENTAKELNN